MLNLFYEKLKQILMKTIMLFTSLQQISNLEKYFSKFLFILSFILYTSLAMGQSKDTIGDREFKLKLDLLQKEIDYLKLQQKYYSLQDDKSIQKEINIAKSNIIGGSILTLASVGFFIGAANNKPSDYDGFIFFLPTDSQVLTAIGVCLGIPGTILLIKGSINLNRKKMLLQNQTMSHQLKIDPEKISWVLTF